MASYVRIDERDNVGIVVDPDGLDAREHIPQSNKIALTDIASGSPVLRYGQVPQIRIHEVEIRGPLVEQWPPAGRQAILGGKPFAPERTREILKNFADRAYRRPVREDEISRLMDVVANRRKQGRTEFEAMKDGLKAVLCSPAFLYLVEPETEP